MYYVQLLYVKHKDDGMLLSQLGFLVASALYGHKWLHKDTDDFLLQLVLLQIQSISRSILLMMPQYRRMAYNQIDME